MTLGKLGCNDLEKDQMAKALRKSSGHESSDAFSNIGKRCPELERMFE
jgi:hypothetical protein